MLSASSSAQQKYSGGTILLPASGLELELSYVVDLILKARPGVYLDDASDILPCLLGLERSAPELMRARRPQLDELYSLLNGDKAQKSPCLPKEAPNKRPKR